MAIQFIFHGGFTPKVVQEDDSFFQEILKSAPQKVNILLVYFAKELDRVPKNREEDIIQFNKNNNNQKTLVFDTATEDSFIKQVAWADIVYLHGGRSMKLLNTLKIFPDLKSVFNGKIIAADSAGVNAISVAFYSQSADGVFNGLGIIPFKTICHYTEEYKDKLSDVSGDIEPLFLSEYSIKRYYAE